MPRIRTLKPEHKQHRKVGMLTDRQYRLWVGMVTEADDEGRLVADPAQLRALVFPYQPRTSVAHVSEAMQALADVGLIRLYRIGDTGYAEFPSWTDHQKVQHPAASKLPSYQPVNGTHESSGALMSIHGGSEGIKDQGSEGIKDRTAAGAADVVTDEFDVFYALYPRKKAPAAARRAWLVAVKKAPPEAITAALRRQLAEFSRRPSDRVPYPATWLNGEHWRNEPDQPKPSPRAVNDPWAGKTQPREVKL